MADGGEIEPWVLNVQTKLGAVIKSPKLAEKLLRKPPFRFLHDIVTSYMKTTNQLQALFTPDELDSAKVTEKEAKIQFLQKIINVVQLANNCRLEAKPSKIIAGGEPEYTCEMLAQLGEMAKLPPGAVDAAVRQVVSGGGAPPSTPPAVAQEPPARQPQPAAAPAPAPVASAAPPPFQPPPVANNNDTQVAARPGTATARKPPPAVKSNEVVESRTDVTAAPVAGVIVDRGRNTGGSDATEETGEQSWEAILKRQEEADARSNVAVDGDAKAKGYLANQALQAKQAQEQAAKAAAEAQQAAAAAGSDAGIVLQTRKKTQSSSSGGMGDVEFSKLREQLQLLTKASNPLGRFLEAIHDDIDTMARELDMWRTESRTQAAAATEAQRQTEEALFAAQGQVAAVEESIKDQLQKTSILRATITNNDRTIESLVKMVVQSEPAAAAKK